MQEVDWERLDKTKFFMGGAGLFSGVTTALYPLSVIKTRQMAIPGMSPGFKGVKQTFLHVLREDGVRGFYRGFGTTIIGSVPVRVVYLTVLEVVKSGGQKTAASLQMGDVQAAALGNFMAGATASICSQGITVPLDVVSQRLMVQGARGMGGSAEGHAAPQYRNGLQAVRMILAAEGVRGLYRGLGPSLATYMPASAIWWSAYGGYQRLIWNSIEGRAGVGEGEGGRPRVAEAAPPGSTVVAVQTAASVAAGLTSGVITNPLDVIKTRIQVAHTHRGGEVPSFRSVLKDLVQRDGPAGLMRGVVPKMANTALWSTCMVSVYEFLKRLAMKEADAPPA